MWKYLLCTVIFSGLVNAAEKQVLMEDYAKGFELVTEDRASIYRFTLPEQVYRNITKLDFSDISVFNHAHEQVPHIIKHQLSNNESTVETLELPYFPLHYDESTVIENKLDVTVSSEGKVIRIQADSDVLDGNDIAKHYLIDISQIDYSIDSIDFKIDGKTTGYSKKIKLESSNDLNNWSSFVRSATLTDLEYGNYSLNNMRVQLPNKKIKYLRFTWVDDAENLFIESIKANFNKNNVVINKKNWVTAKLIDKDNNQGVYEYDAGGLFNIDQINIDLPEDNSLIDVVIQSRPDKGSEWSNKYKGIFYRLYINDTEITREPVSINSSKHRYWRIMLQSTDGIGRGEPSLKFVWRANDLYFLGRGDAPFILAFGNANVKDTTQVSPKLLNIINKKNNGDMIVPAMAGQEILLKGDAALIVEKQLPWQRILLWVILVAGVIVIATMVFRLIKQMDTDSSEL
jgi:uncharacterized protein DUF3999